MNTLRKLLNDFTEYARQEQERAGGEYTQAASTYDDCATQLSAELPKWERMAHEMNEFCDEYDAGGPFTESELRLLYKRFRDALKGIEQ